MSLAYGEIEKPNSFGWEFACGLEVVHLSFCSLGTFSINSGIVFLAPSSTSDLNRMHQKIIESGVV